MVRRDRIRTEHPIFGPDTRLKQKSIPHSSPLSSPMEFWRGMTKIIGHKYIDPIKVKLKVTPEQAQKGSRGITILFP